MKMIRSKRVTRFFDVIGTTWYMRVMVVMIAGALVSCAKSDVVPDASGAFEAQEVIISAQAVGPLLEFGATEGDVLEADSIVARIDDVPLQLRKKQLQAQVAAVLSKTPDAATQLAAVQEQMHVVQRELQRVTTLVQNGSAPKKSLDDVTGAVAVLERQYEALKKSLDITTGGLRAETLPLLAQIDQINDQISRCRVVNPIRGTVLATYAESHELVTQGKPLYKIADLRTMTLRAYAGGASMAGLTLGSNVKVFIDNGGKQKELSGRITWISSKAEFTPKTILTKDERENLVYAMKVTVPNDGTLRIGMYGEIHR